MIKYYSILLYTVVLLFFFFAIHAMIIMNDYLIYNKALEIKKNRRQIRKKKEEKRKNMEQSKLEKLNTLYEKLADTIAEEQIDRLEGKGYAVGKHYANCEKKLMVVGKTFSFEDTEFWGPLQHITEHFLGQHSPEWMEHVAWSSLYKLIPRDGSKLSQELMEQQKELCKEIICAELELLDPTHVLFLTGWTGIWDFDLPIASLLKGETLEGVGQTESGALLMVTRSNVRQLEGKFVHDIMDCIKSYEK